VSTNQTLRRWAKFNLVGLLGMAVQLSALAFLNRLLPGHYLIASSAAIELTLLHNFLWHLNYTWSDRRGHSSRVMQCLRFHLTNGAVSLLGNLVLMRLLVDRAHLPLLLANLIAIVACSIVNFMLSHFWAFAANSQSIQESVVPRSIAMHSIALLVFVFTVAGPVFAQPVPTATPPDRYSQGLGTDCAYANVFAGPAAATDNGSTHLTGTTGVTIGQYFARTLGKGILASPQFELGVVGPIPGGHPVDGFFSVDAMFANKLLRRRIYPFLTGGYTRVFATGNAVNFGLGVDLGKDEYKRLVRVELRDYYLFTGPTQHIVGIRVAFGKFISD
jgi:putative flippase GtrA